MKKETTKQILTHPVSTHCYNDTFNYFAGGNCTVIDMSKIVQHKLQNERERHTR